MTLEGIRTRSQTAESHWSMIDALSQVWASRIQIVSLPFTVIGVLLAWIEVRHPDLAARLSAAITAMGDITGSGLPSLEPMAIRWFPRMLVSALVLFHLWFIWVGWGTVPQERGLRVLWVLAVIVAPIILADLFTRLLRTMMRRLHSMSNGRGLGALGLILAVVGLSGELYQVAVLLWGARSA